MKCFVTRRLLLFSFTWKLCTAKFGNILYFVDDIFPNDNFFSVLCYFLDFDWEMRKTTILINYETNSKRCLWDIQSWKSSKSKSKCYISTQFSCCNTQHSHFGIKWNEKLTYYFYSICCLLLLQNLLTKLQITINSLILISEFRISVFKKWLQSLTFINTHTNII